MKRGGAHPGWQDQSISVGIVRETLSDMVRVRSVGGSCVASLGVEPSDLDLLPLLMKGETQNARGA